MSDMKRLSELVDVTDRKERMRHQLAILDGLLALAVKEKDYKGAVVITQQADLLLKRCQ